MAGEVAEQIGRVTRRDPDRIGLDQSWIPEKTTPHGAFPGAQQAGDQPATGATGQRDPLAERQLPQAGDEYLLGPVP